MNATSLLRNGLALLSLPLLLSTALGVSSNLALNRAAYHSSSVDDDHTGHLSTDWSLDTYWESKIGGEQWLSVDLGEAQQIASLRLRWGSSYPTRYVIEVSSEGIRPTQWRNVFEQTDGQGNTEVISFAPATARHVRVRAIYFRYDRGCILNEIEVWGDARDSRIALPPQPPPQADGSLLLTGGNWRLQSASFVRDTPDSISRGGYDDSKWIPAIVPGTVLTSYLKYGAVPDPRYADQQNQLSEAFFTGNDFWYRNAFEVPAAYSGKRVWLNFDGINWKAEIYFNGHAIGRIDGAFIRGRFDVTEYARAGEMNHLAVLVRKVAHPGKITHKMLHYRFENGGILGADSPTFVSSIGWNWLPTVRGRNVGIWNDVRLEASGDVTLVDPWVKTNVDLSGKTKADLSVNLELRNHAGAPRKGLLVGKIGSVSFQQPYELKAFETKALSLDKNSFPQLTVAEPSLWWPNGYGKQPLYRLELDLQSQGRPSDHAELNFGIRNIEYKVDSKNSLQLYVNGHRILVRGGNWGMEEGNLDCDAAGYDLRVRLHRDMNLNMIRNWVGMIGKKAFYEACDRHGLLIWDDFWLANPVDGPPPDDAEMFFANARDKVRRVRSHASLALYCGRNEGMPPPVLDEGMQTILAELDPSRHYVPNSADGTVTGLGPYDVRDPDWYFANRGITFHSEQGIICVPPVESMRAMMPADRLWPINDMWALHDYQSPRMPLYTKRINERYGDATDIEDYCRKAQMVNMETAKAMYECVLSNQGSGLVIWMTQSAWPSLICQLYDYYFETTAGYYGAKKGSEPLHILWDSATDRVKVANARPSPTGELTAEAKIHDMQGRQLWQRSSPVSLGAGGMQDCFALELPEKPGAVYFIKLRLRRGEQIISDNIYWSAGRGKSCKALADLPLVSLVAKASHAVEGTMHRVVVDVANPGATPAVMIRLKVQRSQSAERVLPAVFDDNYLTLLPGEQKRVSVQFETSALAGEEPRLLVEGWNITPAEIPVSKP